MRPLRPRTIGLAIWFCILAVNVFALYWFTNVPAQSSLQAQVITFTAEQEDLLHTQDGHTLLGIMQDRATVVPPPTPLPKYVALTFDDGPHPKYTAQLLDLLKEKQVPGTFYVLGYRTEKYPEIARRIVNEGHQIGNHTWDHALNARTPEDVVRGDFTGTADVIETITGVRPTTVRVPRGEYSQAIKDAAPGPLLYWSLDTRDWQTRDANVVVHRTMNQVHPGAVILLHDIYQHSIEATAHIIDQLKTDGYTFMTVDELFQFDTHPEKALAGEAFFVGDVVEFLEE